MAVRPDRTERSNLQTPGLAGYQRGKAKEEDIPENIEQWGKVGAEGVVRVVRVQGVGVRQSSHASRARWTPPPDMGGSNGGEDGGGGGEGWVICLGGGSRVTRRQDPCATVLTHYGDHPPVVLATHPVLRFEPG